MLYNKNQMHEEEGYYAGYSDGFREYPLADVKKKKSSGAGKKIIAAAICCSILGGAAGAAGTFAGIKYFSSDKTAEAVSDEDEDKEATTLLNSDRKTAVNTAKVSSGTLMTASEVYEQNVNSTVGITTEINTNYFGYETTAAAAGSGFIISADGYILTNYHVIEDASSITVTAYDGKTYKAELVGSDSSNDIAILKIDADGLTPVVLGNSSDLAVGDEVAAIGNPLGELTFSLTQGVVSALDREVTAENMTMMNLIQTDCAINSGNSGGALFNMYGEVVGITNAKYSSSGVNEASIDNIGFAIPIDSVKDIVTSIIENGYAVKPYIGVSVEDVSDEVSEYGIPSGAAVRSVTENSPAEKAGLKEDDIIVEADGEKIEGSSDLIAAVKSKSKGDKMTLKVYRQGEYVTVYLIVDETKQDDTLETENEQSSQNGSSQNRHGDDFYDEFGEIPGFGNMFGY